MEKDTQIIRTSLRLTLPMYDKLNQAATEKGVTMHAEILSRLEESFESEKAALTKKSVDEIVGALAKLFKEEGGLFGLRKDKDE